MIPVVTLVKCRREASTLSATGRMSPTVFLLEIQSPTEDFIPDIVWFAACTLSGPEVQHVQNIHHRYAARAEAGRRRNPDEALGDRAAQNLERRKPGSGRPHPGDRSQQCHSDEPRGRGRNFRADEGRRQVLLRRRSNQARPQTGCPQVSYQIAQSFKSAAFESVTAN